VVINLRKPKWNLTNYANILNLHVDDNWNASNGDDATEVVVLTTDGLLIALGAADANDADWRAVNANRGGEVLNNDPKGAEQGRGGRRRRRLDRVAALNGASIALAAGLRTGRRRNGGGHCLSRGSGDRHWWDSASIDDRKERRDG